MNSSKEKLLPNINNDVQNIFKFLGVNLFGGAGVGDFVKVTGGTYNGATGEIVGITKQMYKLQIKGENKSVRVVHQRNVERIDSEERTTDPPPSSPPSSSLATDPSPLSPSSPPSSSLATDLSSATPSTTDPSSATDSPDFPLYHKNLDCKLFEGTQIWTGTTTSDSIHDKMALVYLKNIIKDGEIDYSKNTEIRIPAMPSSNIFEDNILRNTFTDYGKSIENNMRLLDTKDKNILREKTILVRDVFSLPVLQGLNSFLDQTTTSTNSYIKSIFFKNTFEEGGGDDGEGKGDDGEGKGDDGEGKDVEEYEDETIKDDDDTIFPFYSKRERVDADPTPYYSVLLNCDIVIFSIIYDHLGANQEPLNAEVEKIFTEFLFKDLFKDLDKGQVEQILVEFHQIFTKKSTEYIETFRDFIYTLGHYNYNMLFIQNINIINLNYFWQHIIKYCYTLSTKDTNITVPPENGINKAFECAINTLKKITFISWDTVNRGKYLLNPKFSINCTIFDPIKTLFEDVKEEVKEEVCEEGPGATGGDYGIYPYKTTQQICCRGAMNSLKKCLRNVHHLRPRKGKTKEKIKECEAGLKILISNLDTDDATKCIANSYIWSLLKFIGDSSHINYYFLLVKAFKHLKIYDIQYKILLEERPLFARLVQMDIDLCMVPTAKFYDNYNIPPEYFVDINYDILKSIISTIEQYNTRIKDDPPVLPDLTNNIDGLIATINKYVGIEISKEKDMTLQTADIAEFFKNKIKPENIETEIKNLKKILGQQIIEDKYLKLCAEIPEKYTVNSLLVNLREEGKSRNISTKQIFKYPNIVLDKRKRQEIINFISDIQLCKSIIKLRRDTHEKDSPDPVNIMLNMLKKTGILFILDTKFKDFKYMGSDIKGHIIAIEDINAIINLTTKSVESYSLEQREFPNIIEKFISELCDIYITYKNEADIKLKDETCEIIFKQSGGSNSVHYMSIWDYIPQLNIYDIRPIWNIDKEIESVNTNVENVYKVINFFDELNKILQERNAINAMPINTPEPYKAVLAGGSTKDSILCIHYQNWEFHMGFVTLVTYMTKLITTDSSTTELKTFQEQFSNELSAIISRTTFTTFYKQLVCTLINLKFQYTNLGLSQFYAEDCISLVLSDSMLDEKYINKLKKGRILEQEDLREIAIHLNTKIYYSQYNYTNNEEGVTVIPTTRTARQLRREIPLEDTENYIVYDDLKLFFFIKLLFQLEYYINEQKEIDIDETPLKDELLNIIFAIYVNMDPNKSVYEHIIGNVPEGTTINSSFSVLNELSQEKHCSGIEVLKQIVEFFGIEPDIVSITSTYGLAEKVEVPSITDVQGVFQGGGAMRPYSQIVDPITGITHTTNSETGRYILKKFIDRYKNSHF